MISRAEHEQKIKEVRAFCAEQLVVKYARRISELNDLLEETLKHLRSDYEDERKLILRIKAELRNDR